MDHLKSTYVGVWMIQMMRSLLQDFFLNFTQSCMFLSFLSVALQLLWINCPQGSPLDKWAKFDLHGEVIHLKHLKLLKISDWKRRNWKKHHLKNLAKRNLPAGTEHYPQRALAPQSPTRTTKRGQSQKRRNPFSTSLKWRNDLQFLRPRSVLKRLTTITVKQIKFYRRSSLESNMISCRLFESRLYHQQPRRLQRTNASRSRRRERWRGYYRWGIRRSKSMIKKQVPKVQLSDQLLTKAVIGIITEATYLPFS